MSSQNRPGLVSPGLTMVTNREIPQTTVIESTRGWSSLGLRDLWEYRELIFFLVIREIQGVYRQTALGMSWIFLRPVINTLLLTLVFGNLVKIPSDNVPYAIFSLAAQIPWGYFSNAVMRTSRSLVDNTHVVSKVYFPRMVLPLAGSISGLVDMGASMIVFAILFAIYRMPLRIEMLWLPGLVVVSAVSALAAGLWLATLAVKYRDVSFAITFLLQALMYLSPVIYPISMVPTSLRLLYQLNPITGVIQGFRWALLGNSSPPGGLFWVDILIIFAGLISGAYLFRRAERTIVDII
jgi:lipopolysaccharide transport system permease protein